ncbi:unnamed protein product [Pleuronectes platessa]|uniref:Uncharacterized protein n=1 Tax=Pleuronectes platessa TaxID=8262 RepID=A0A9N7Z9S6_PLEPL|nr:unnamed protein product [Pleuronectes platessa]
MRKISPKNPHQHLTTVAHRWKYRLIRAEPRGRRTGERLPERRRFEITSRLTRSWQLQISGLLLHRRAEPNHPNRRESTQQPTPLLVQVCHNRARRGIVRKKTPGRTTRCAPQVLD